MSTDNLTIKDIATKLQSQSDELTELKKAMQLTTDSPNSMQIEYTTEIKSKIFEQAPYVRFLESKGCVKPTKSSRISFYIEENGAQAQFIAEDADIPDSSATKYSEKPATMTTLINPIYVSMMAQKGNDVVDLIQRELDKGFINIKNKVDSALLQGDGKNNVFEGFTTQVTSNKTDLAGAELTEDAIDDMLTKIIDGNGGNVDCIVTSANVGKQLKKLVAPYRRYNDKVDIELGHRVTTYESLNGSEIPILIDSNLNASENGDNMLFVDSSTIEVRELMSPTVLDNLPVNKLGYKMAIVNFITSQNIAEFRNGLITGIGKK